VSGCGCLRVLVYQDVGEWPSLYACDVGGGGGGWGGCLRMSVYQDGGEWVCVSVCVCVRIYVCLCECKVYNLSINAITNYAEATCH